MTILKNHISLVTFLRPGFIEVQTREGNEKLFIEEGTVEFNNNNLLILSSSAKNIKDLSKDEVNQMIEDSEEKFRNEKIRDKEKYILSHKLDVLKEIRK